MAPLADSSAASPIILGEFLTPFSIPMSWFQVGAPSWLGSGAYHPLLPLSDQTPNTNFSGATRSCVPVKVWHSPGSRLQSA